jgi:D-alanyl-D-alanine endopeptidase (penicillin-binding protein 7)
VTVDAIANWIWQGSVVALAATVILRTRRISAATRYRAWWIALTLVLALPFVGVAPGMPAALPQSDAPLATPQAGSFNIALPDIAGWAVPFAIAFLAVWCGVHIVRIARSIAGLHRVKRACRAFPDERSARLREWSSVRGSGRSATLVLSSDVRTAAVLGLTSPAIAVSPSVLLALTDDELDGIVMHEWAHVQRHDDWGRLVQVAVRAVVGFHPAMWWIDRQIHLERETTCDDWAVSHTRSPRTYATGLTKLAELGTWPPEPVLLPSALVSSDLARRVVRLLDAGRDRSTRPRFGAIAIVSSILALTTIAVGSVELVVGATPQVVLPAPIEAVRDAVAGDRLPDSVPTVAEPRPMRRPSHVPERAPRQTAVTAPASEPASRTVRTDPSSASARPASSPQTPDGPSVVGATDLPGTPISLPSPPNHGAVVTNTQSESTKEPTPWGAAATAGVGIGRGSQKAATATAGFFSRLGKSIAGSF